MTTEDDQKEAIDQLKGRLAEMRTYLDFEGDDEEGPEELGPIYEYGLEWTKAITSHRDETVIYVHVLSTGGPHEEFNVTFDPTQGTVERVVFVSLPWFGREEIDLQDNPGHYRPGDYDTAKEFYERFYGDLVVMEHEGDSNG